MIPRRRYDHPRALAFEVIAAIHGRRVRFGPSVSELEEAAGTALGLTREGGRVLHATGSGRRALAVLLEALAVPKRSDVLVPGYTLGALPRFLRSEGYGVAVCDVGADQPLVSADAVEAALNDDVGCVLVTHLFGRAADAPAIVELCASRGLAVVEDCAHALGATLGGRPLGTFGDGAIFSFDYLKPVNAYGGGMALARGGEGARRLNEREHLEPPLIADVFQRIATGVAEDLIFAGPWLRLIGAALDDPELRALVDRLDRAVRRTSRPSGDGLSNLQARLGVLGMETLYERLRSRREVARAILAALDLHDPSLAEGSATRGNAYQVIVRAAPGEDAASLRGELRAIDIDAGFGFEIMDCLEGPGAEGRPNAADWSHRALQLPCHSEMPGRMLGLLCERLAGFRGRLLL